MGFFLGAKAPLLAHLRGVSPKGLSDRRAELDRLDQKRREGTDIVRPRPIGHSAQRVLVTAAGAQFKHHRPELLGQPGMRRGHLHPPSCERRLEAEPGLDAHQEKVERIGEAVDQLLLTPGRPRPDEQAGT